MKFDHSEGNYDFSVHIKKYIIRHSGKFVGKTKLLPEKFAKYSIPC